MARTTEQIELELLVLDCQDGSRDAMERLLVLWVPRLEARAQTLCGSHEGAAEVVQRSLIAMARSIGRLDDPAAFAGWSMRIVAHKSADWIRERRRERARGAGPDGARDPEAAPRSAADAGGHDAARVRLALDELSPERRALLGLHYGHGVSVEGIARSLGIAVGTAKSRLFHARKDLRRLLER